MDKCCICLARDAAGVFMVNQVFKYVDGREMETVLRAPFCSQCKDDGIKRVWMSVGEISLRMATEPTISGQDTRHEWKEFN